jgi:hypothetical protein
MSAINPNVQFAVPDFLQLLEGIKLGEIEPPRIVEQRTMMANTVLLFLVHGDDSQVTLADIALSSLCRATITLCDNPTDTAAVQAFIEAREAYDEVSG